MPTRESHLPRAASFTLATSLARRSAFRKAVTGARSLVSLSTITAMPTPQLGWQPQLSWPHSCCGPYQIAPVGESGHEGDGEPIADGLAHSGLVLHIMRQVGKRVALRGAAVVGDGLIAAGERYRLEREKRNLLGVIERELHNAAHLLIIDAVDDGDDRDDIDAVGIQILDGAQLHVEEIAHLAVLVGGVADAVELQVRVTQTGIRGLAAKLRALGELNAIGGSLHGGVTHFARITDGFQEVRRNGGLAARELHRHLALGLNRDGVVEQGLNIFPAQLMHEADLVGIHETGIAHHVAAVGEVHREHGAPAVRDGAGAVLVQLGIVVGADIAAGEYVFQVLEEGRIDGHDVFKMAVNRAVLDHQDFAIALDHLGLDLARFAVVEDIEGRLAVQNLLADLGDAARAQGIRLARPTQWGLGLFIGLEQRLIRPRRHKARILADPIEFFEGKPSCARSVCQGFLSILNRLVHFVRNPPAFKASIGKAGRTVLPNAIKMLKLLLVRQVERLNGGLARSSAYGGVAV